MKIPKTIDLENTPYPSGDQMAGAMGVAAAKGADSVHGESAQSMPLQEYMRILIRLADQIWRIGTVVLDSDSGEAKAELSPRDIRKVSNAIEAMQEDIQSMGIRVIDRCNQDFDPGLPDQVVTEEPMEGISKERIIRTIRPTIMRHQTMVQRGEIDIAVPTQTKDAEPSSIEP